MVPNPDKWLCESWGGSFTTYKEFGMSDKEIVVDDDGDCIEPADNRNADNIDPDEFQIERSGRQEREFHVENQEIMGEIAAPPPPRHEEDVDISLGDSSGNIFRQSVQDSQPHTNPNKFNFEEAKKKSSYNISGIIDLLTNDFTNEEIKSHLKVVTEEPIENLRIDGQENVQEDAEDLEDDVRRHYNNSASGAPVRLPEIEGIGRVTDISKGCIKLLLKANNSEGLKELLQMYTDGRLVKELEKLYITDEIQKKAGNVKLKVTVDALDIETLKQKISMLEKVENDLKPNEDEDLGGNSKNKLEITSLTFAYCEVSKQWFWCEGEVGTETPLSCIWLPLRTTSYNGRRPEERFLKVMTILANSGVVPPENHHDNCLVCHNRSTIAPETEEPPSIEISIKPNGKVESPNQGTVHEIQFMADLQSETTDSNLDVESLQISRPPVKDSVANTQTSSSAVREGYYINDKTTKIELRY